MRTDETRNYGDDLRNRKGRSTAEIDFTAGDTSGDDMGDCEAGNRSNTLINDDNYEADNGTTFEGNNKNAGNRKGVTGNNPELETVNESITLESCISLDNSRLGTVEIEQKGKPENGRTNSAARKDGTPAEWHRVTVQNEDLDSEVGDDNDESVYSIDLGSNITLGDETGKVTDITDWDPSKIAGGNGFEPAATSTQYVNVITKTDSRLATAKVDNKLRVIPKNYTQATTGKLGEIWQPVIEKEMNAMAEHYIWDIVERPKNCKPLPCSWKFSYKDDGMAKARLYLVGNREPFDSIQNTYSPVTDMKHTKLKT